MGYSLPNAFVLQESGSGVGLGLAPICMEQDCWIRVVTRLARAQKDPAEPKAVGMMHRCAAHVQCCIICIATGTIRDVGNKRAEIDDRGVRSWEVKMQVPPVLTKFGAADLQRWLDIDCWGRNAFCSN